MYSYLALLLLALMLIGCGSKASAAETEPTGLAKVDAAIAAVLNRDSQTLMSLLSRDRLEQCYDKSEEGFYGPGCEQGQPQGTPVPTVLRVACSGDLHTVDYMVEELQRFAARSSNLESVYYSVRLLAGQPAKGYVAVFEMTQTGSSRLRRHGLAVDESGIVAVLAGCQPDQALPGEVGATIVYQRPSK